jgi:hypothetical protein
MVSLSNSRKRSLDLAAETSSPTADLQQIKKMKKVLATKTRNTTKTSKTTKKLKAGKEETSKTVTVSEEVTNKRLRKKTQIIDL